MQKFIHFIKYNNGFILILAIIFFSVGAVFAANPEILVSGKENIKSVDNSYILNVDLENFDFGLMIRSITEDDKNYYINYGYKTIYIQDYVWMDIQKEKNIVVEKDGLAGKDLGLYIVEQLNENIDNELAYLKEVQKMEMERGLTQKIVATEYSGLIGKFFNPGEKTFPGYQPVVLENNGSQEATVQKIIEPKDSILVDTRPENNPNPPIAVGSIDKKALQKLVEELLIPLSTVGQGPQNTSVSQEPISEEQPQQLTEEQSQIPEESVETEISESDGSEEIENSPNEQSAVEQSAPEIPQEIPSE